MDDELESAGLQRDLALLDDGRLIDEVRQVARFAEDHGCDVVGALGGVYLPDPGVEGGSFHGRWIKRDRSLGGVGPIRRSDGVRTFQRQTEPSGRRSPVAARAIAARRRFSRPTATASKACESPPIRRSGTTRYSCARFLDSAVIRVSSTSRYPYTATHPYHDSRIQRRTEC